MGQILSLGLYTGLASSLSLLVGGRPELGAAIGAGLWGVVSYMRTPSKHALPKVSGGGVVISGASSGIGFAAAKELAGMGYMVFGGIRKEKDGDALKEAGCIPIILEVTSEESVAKAVEEVRAQLAAAGKPLVAVVNNAGVSGASLPLELETDKNLDMVNNVNVRGVIRMSRLFAPLLREGNDLGNGGGRIVNIGSVMGHLTAPSNLAYCMSKFSVEAVTKISRQELSKFGIAVIVVNPGFVRTELINKSAGNKQEEVRALRAQYPEEMHELYPSIFNEEIAQKTDNAVKNMFQKCPPPSTSTTPAIVHAITSNRPQPAYIVGNLSPTSSFPSASLGLYLDWLLPQSFKDSFMTKKPRKQKKSDSKKQ